MKGFDTVCLSDYNHTIKESKNFVTITVRVPEDREDTYFNCEQFAKSQNCHSERVLNQNISSIPYLLING